MNQMVLGNKRMAGTGQHTGKLMDVLNGRATYENPLVQAQPCGYTMEDVYPVWLCYKAHISGSSSCIARIASDWRRFYEGDPIIKKDLAQIGVTGWEAWLNTICRNNSLTTKAYSNMSTIPRQIYRFAAANKWIVPENNPFLGDLIKINPKNLIHKRRPEAATQVYNEQESSTLIDELLREYASDPERYYAAPVPLVMFYTGIRVSEALALRLSDIELGPDGSKYLHIQRELVADYRFDEDNHPHKAGYKVRNRTKTDGSNRLIYISEEASLVIQMAAAHKKNEKTCHNDFIFTKDGQFITYPQVQYRLMQACSACEVKYLDPCARSGAPFYRSTHKIRKTFISTLLDNGYPLSDTSLLAGHADPNTTLKNYYFSTSEQGKLNRRLEEILRYGDEGTDKLSNSACS